jgi:hypothetical protein
MNEILETLAEELGKYFHAQISAFLLPLILMGLVFWLVKWLLPSRPDPDYRLALVALQSALILLRIIALVFLPVQRAGILVLTLEILFLSAMGVWAIFRMGFWPLVLLLGYAVASLIGSVGLLFHPEIDSVGIASVLAMILIYLGILLNAVVGLKVRRSASTLNSEG